MFFVAASSPRYYDLSGVVYWASMGVAFGAGTGLCALLGGVINTLPRARPDDPAALRAARASTGAAVGAGTGWVALACFTWPWSVAVAVIGAVCAGLSAYVARRLIAHAERRAASRPS